MATVPLNWVLLGEIPKPPTAVPGRGPVAVSATPVAAERISVPAGTRLLTDPDSRARALTLIDVDLSLEVLSRSGPWAEVRYRSYRGWIRLEGEGSAESGDPNAMGASSASPASPGRADLGLLAIGKGLLRAPGDGRPFGPFHLFTDVRDERLLGELAKIAASLPEAYKQRYGVESGLGPTIPGDASATDFVLLFAGETAYRAFERSDETLADRKTRGHARNGLASLFVEPAAPRGDGLRDDREELRATLVHELVHLLNRRALGQRLPPWLEEGLAEELSYAELDRSGKPIGGTLRGRRREVSYKERDERGRERLVTRRDLSGPLAAGKSLSDDARRGALRKLVELTKLSDRDYTDPDSRRATYAHGAFFIRFLMEAEGAKHRPRFLSFLKAVAEGAPAGGALLPDFLDTDWEGLEKSFRAYLATQRVEP